MKMSPEEKERRKFLRKELREYLKTTETTPDELEALKEWVAEGNSVYENGSNAFYEDGTPVWFLDEYCHWRDLESEVESEAESPREQQKDHGSDADSASGRTTCLAEKSDNETGGS